jgi:hypothetical protein
VHASLKLEVNRCISFELLSSPDRNCVTIDSTSVVIQARTLPDRHLSSPVPTMQGGGAKEAGFGIRSIVAPCAQEKHR